MADICAPSWQPHLIPENSYLNAWLAHGFAIVATDYQGLGTPGPHPYQIVRAAAYNVLDSIRAVLHSQPNLADRIVVAGFFARRGRCLCDRWLCACLCGRTRNSGHYNDRHSQLDTGCPEIPAS